MPIWLIQCSDHIPEYNDDILIYNQTWEKHLNHFKVVLQVLEDNQFFANKNKWTFEQIELEYLGHLITQKSVKMDPNKVQAIMEWPTPQNVTSIRDFLRVVKF